jgi:hypothetical protein
MIAHALTSDEGGKQTLGLWSDVATTAGAIWSDVEPAAPFVIFVI